MIHYLRTMAHSVDGSPVYRVWCAGRQEDLTAILIQAGVTNPLVSVEQTDFGPVFSHYCTEHVMERIRAETVLFLEPSFRIWVAKTRKELMGESYKTKSKPVPKPRPTSQPKSRPGPATSLSHGQSLAARLIELRGSRTVVEYSKLTGIGESTLWNIEHGNQSPRLDTLQKIAKFHGLGVDEVLRGVTEASMEEQALQALRTLKKKESGLMIIVEKWLVSLGFRL